MRQQGRQRSNNDWFWETYLQLLFRCERSTFSFQQNGNDVTDHPPRLITLTVNKINLVVVVVWRRHKTQCKIREQDQRQYGYPVPGRGTGYCFRAISLFLCQQHYEKTTGPICMKFSGKVWSDHGTTWLHFGSIRVNGSAGHNLLVITGHNSEDWR